MSGDTAVPGSKIHITGVVQGVGFRPFVYGLAQRYQLTGWVRNTSAGVDIEVAGPPEKLAAFAHALQAEAPPLARIDTLAVQTGSGNGFAGFAIIGSQSLPGAFQPIAPDVSVCPDCRRELLDPQDRRYRYPFINCTNCGPRFTIIRDIPYDRPQTTMAPFAMCPACAAEYHDPLDRRFHAQPVACPLCGPHVWLETSGQPATDTAPDPGGEAAIQAARRLLREGKIVAVKGLGGFHLACDATNPAAVNELRRRKLRVEKPFALMMADVTAVSHACLLSEPERELLESHARPILILRRRPDSTLYQGVATGQQTLGVMLPYTPLHFLLLEPEPGFPPALVMTSGNVSEEPIAYDNDDARQRLAPLADAFLFHNRDIHSRCDDSVMRLFSQQLTASEPAPPDSRHSIMPLRRSRGYAPFPVKLPWSLPPVLATGAELKNTFCLTRDDYAFLSHHIGDMENYETLRSFEEGIAHFERLFRCRPEILAYDLHPDYLATRYAQERAKREGLTAVAVQHHHAHIAACLAEHKHDGRRPVLGVAFDGTGYGADGAIWGGEFLLAGYEGYQRLAHLAYAPLPGGDKAVKEPWRIALAYLHQAGLPWDEALPPLQWLIHQRPSEATDPVVSANRLSGGQRLEILRRQLQTGVNAPFTSSMGRLFDAVAALAGVRAVVNYEAQAAIELEALVDSSEAGAYPLPLENGLIDTAPLVAAVVADLRAGARAGQIAARFHNGVARMVVDVCRRLCRQHAVKEIVLSGGVWQNVTLLTPTVAGLQKAGGTVYIHSQAPANDGGLALGQAVIAGRGMDYARGAPR
jgi:hydrogenase maturation protein HypF